MILGVTRPDGTKYIPKTRVKNTLQAERFGVSVGEEIPIVARPSTEADAKAKGSM